MPTGPPDLTPLTSSGQTAPGVPCAVLETSLQKGRGQNGEGAEESDENDPGPGDQVL